MRPFTLRPSVVIAFVAPLLELACGSTSKSDVDSDLVRSSLSRDTAPVLGATDATTLALDDTRFALDMYHQIAPGSPDANVAYSPYSMSIALGMLYAGASGATADGMRAALHFTLPANALHPAFDALDLSLASRAKGQGGTGGQKFALNIANSLWEDSTFELEKPFLDTLAVDYGTGVHAVDFEHAAEPARTRINSWVSDETNGKIADLMPPGSVVADTRLVLVNAIYFDAGWAKAFDPADTLPGAFHKLDGTTISANMMSVSLSGAGYFAGANYQAVELAYQGNQTSMVVVVPQDGAFDAVEGALTGDFVTTLFSSLSADHVAVKLPRFTVKGATISLKTALSGLGMADAFSDAADFSAMTKEPVEVGDVLHQAFVQVNEQGTEAAAATAVEVRTASADIDLDEVDADRPFFYFIRDIPTNTVLFVGREVDPT